MMSVRARETAATSRLIKSIARVDLRVQDIHRALAFYRDVVGLEVVSDDSTTATLRSAAGEPFLTLESSGVAAPADPSATGLFHTAFRFPTRASLGDALARLVDAGCEVGAGDHLVSEALYIDDPGGNGVELYWDRPADEWPAPTDEMLVPMATLPVDMRSLMEEGTGRAAVGGAAPERTDIGHVHLQVSDIEATTRFYTGVLGLDLTARLGGSAGFFSSYGYHHNIGANTWRSRGGRPAGPERAGLQRVVFKVDEGSALHGLRDRLGATDAVLQDEHDAVIVVDPDGIELHFTL